MSSINNIEDLEKFIQTNSDSSNSYPGLKNAITAFEDHVGVSFYEEILPKIRKLASGLDFTTFVFKIKPNEFKLTRLEIAAFIANCFLCTNKSLSCLENPLDDLEIDFEKWFMSPNNESFHKILCILQYLHFTCKCHRSTLKETVHYKKHRVSPLGGGAIENPHKILSQLQIDAQTEPELLKKETAKIVFGDKKYIGGNLYSDCCFQEEIELVVRPELILTPLLGEMDDDEAVTVTGAKKFSCHTGFGETFQFRGGPNPNFEDCPVIVLTHFCVVSESGKLRQYTYQAIKNYIASAFSAIINLQNVDTITFEFWGWRDDKISSNCEVDKAMVADPAVVLLTMWIAASMAFKEVIFRQNVNADLGNCVSSLCNTIGGDTIDAAYTKLLEYCDLMLNDPNPMINTNDVIFDAFKSARPGFKKIATEKSNSIYKWVLDKMHKNIAQHKDSKPIQSYTIVNVYKIYNYRLWERYCEREWEVKQDLGRNYLHKHEYKRLFHGTSAAEAIAKSGFDISRSSPKGMLGQGIYFAHLSSKSVQYTQGGFRAGCKQHNQPECTTCPRSMLVCRVLFGNKYEAPLPMKFETSPPADYHSVEANPRSFNISNNRPVQFLEYSIYNNYQAYPGYLVEFTVNT